MMPSMKSVLYFTALVSLPLYAWNKLYKLYRVLKLECEEEELFHKRHNCAVMYAKNKGMSGWPPRIKRIQFDVNNLNVFIEPYLYFINTSKTSLDIAVMGIRAPAIFQAIEEANDRGVYIRMILNHEGNGAVSVYRDLMKKGIQIAFYISELTNLSSILHYKYMLKDCKENSGFLCMGSLNLSDQATLNNFEDVVFTSDPHVAEAFHKNFEYCWNLITSENQSMFNTTVLRESNLLI